MSPGDRIAAGRARWAARQGWFGMVVELLLALTIAGIVLFVSTWPSITVHLPLEQAGLLLALAAAGLGAGAALTAELTSRMSAPSLVRGFSSALACYAIVLTPLTVIHTYSALGGLRAAGLVGNVCFLVILLCAVFPTRYRWLSGWRALIWACAATILAGLLAGWLPGYGAFFVAGATLPERLVLIAWFLVAAMIMVRGAVARQSATWRIGLGVGVIAIAHLIQVGHRHGSLPFASLRTLGLLVLAVALAVHAREVARIVAARRDAESQRLREVATAAAERDHEMRNLVYGLSGAAYLLSSGEQASSELGGAVQRELARLQGLLEPVRASVTGDESRVDEDLRRLVMIHAAGGEQVKLAAEPGLRAAMPGEVLSQVVTNLLMNCARHAPGAPVLVTANAASEGVVITVADDGPGLAGRSPARDGGVGVPVCVRLLAEYGGDIRFEPGRAAGCVAVVTVPSAEPRKRVELPQVMSDERSAVGIA